MSRWKSPEEQNQKLPAKKKKDFKSKKNISRIYWVTLLKSLINLSKIIIDRPLDIKLEQFTKKELDAGLRKKLKAKKLLASTKCLLNYGQQENMMMTYFFDYTTLSTNKRQLRNEPKNA